MQQNQMVYNPHMQYMIFLVYQSFERIVLY
jgi:hypothetical protein